MAFGTYLVCPLAKSHCTLRVTELRENTDFLNDYIFFKKYQEQLSGCS